MVTDFEVSGDDTNGHIYMFAAKPLKIVGSGTATAQVYWENASGNMVQSSVAFGYTRYLGYQLSYLCLTKTLS